MTDITVTIKEWPKYDVDDDDSLVIPDTSLTAAIHLPSIIQVVVAVPDSKVSLIGSYNQLIKDHIKSKALAFLHDELTAALDETLPTEEELKSGGPVTNFVGNFSGAPVVSDLKKYFPALSKYVQHPEAEGEHPLADIIVDLNDRHDWTREQIADWMETLDLDISINEALDFEFEDGTIEEDDPLSEIGMTLEEMGQEATKAGKILKDYFAHLDMEDNDEDIN